jgi:hypothetical protein
LKRIKAWQKALAVVPLLMVALALGFGPRLLQHLSWPGYLPPVPLGPPCTVPLQISQHDQNGNGIPDALDLVAGAAPGGDRAYPV